MKNMHKKRGFASNLDATAKTLVKAGIEKFRNHFEDSVKQLLLAARQYATDMENYPKLAPKMYREAFPRVTDRSWELLRKIGIGDLVPNAFFTERDKSINMAAKVPYKLQQVLLGDVDRDPVPQNLLVNGKVVHKLYCDMNSAEASKLLDTEKGKVRTIEEQKNYVPVKIMDNCTIAPAEAPYYICGNVVLFKKHCEVGVNEHLQKARAHCHRHKTG